MHSPWHKSPATSNHTTRPRLKVNKSSGADDDDFLKLLQDDSEQMRYPPDSPARKRVPWSPSRKNNNKVLSSVSSPSHKLPSQVNKAATTSLLLLPTAEPPFASCAAGGPPRRKKSSDLPYALALLEESKHTVDGRLLLFRMLWHRNSLLGVLGLLLTTAALHRSVAVTNLFSSLSVQEEEAVAHHQAHHGMLSSMHANGKLQSSSGTGGGQTHLQSVVHGMERQTQQQQQQREDEKDADPLTEKNGISTTSRNVVVHPQQQQEITDTIELGFPSTAEEPLKSTTSPEFAVAYVVGGCDPDKPAYRNFLQDIFVNTHLQHQNGSKSDVVVFIQMLFHSKFDSLPNEDLRWLDAMNIKIEMIPKSEDESFDQIMMEKFRILNLTQYRRVLFLDADIMVRGSLDYLFGLSKSGTLKRNVIFADEYAPAAGSIFMVTPAEGDWDLILDIVHEKKERGASLPYPHWDETVGWGHKFEDGDSYELISGKKDSSWDFLGSSSDLGLLYHWVKYKEKSVSIILKDSIQHWGTDEKGLIRLESTATLSEVFGGYGSQRECWKGTLNDKPCAVPHSDIVHFTSTKKPWLHSPPKDLSERTASASPMHLWYHTLSRVNQKLGMGLNFMDWSINPRPLLGMHPNAIEAVVSVPDDTLAMQHGNQEQRTADFAYAYVIGGCKPEDNSYVYYFYDILINTYLQQKENSKADVIVFVQMSFQSAYDTLPDEDIRLFNSMNIKVEYIPKAEDESFYRIMLDKFLTLGLTQYKRVLFLDGDILTRGSMDYLFDLSIQGKLQENVVFAGNTEPANGGTFMVAPKKDSWDRLLDIIRKKEERGAVLPYPHWNKTIGWGHVIEEDDYWETFSKSKSQSWNFHGSFADQGLLYHWVKYEEKSVSIVFGLQVQHWGPGEDGKVHHLHSTGLNVFNQGSIKPVERQACWMKHRPCRPPHLDFNHFTGTGKPWLQGPPEDFGIASENESAKHYWFYVLDILNKKLEMNLDFDKWRKGHRPSLGFYPKHKDVAKTSYASSK